MIGKSKRVFALILAALTAASLTACGTKEDAAATAAAETTSAAESIEITEAAETTEVPETAADESTSAVETAQVSYRGVYAQKLSELRTKYGVLNGDADAPTGVALADLLDWDHDGTPEFLTLTKVAAGDDDVREKFRLAVWQMKDGEAAALLDTEVGSFYGNLGSLLYFSITRNRNGALTILVEDSHEYADIKETYYTFADGKLQSDVLTAQSSIGGWTDDPDPGNVRPVDPDAYQINGKACSKAEFEAQGKANGYADGLSVWCQDRYNMDALDAFLSGQSDVYPGGALLQSASDDSGRDEPTPQWVFDALFTVDS